LAIIQKSNRIASEIFDQIVTEAVYHKTSDIHFEPKGKEVLIRLRIDGLLVEAGRIPQDYYLNVLNRIKVLADLRIDEHFASQDGAIHFQNDDFEADLRVSIIPTILGEKIVIRLLSEYVRELNPLDLGISAENQTIIQSAIAKPFGLVVSSGPTGSGKTTTLYSLLKGIQSSEKNITTIEDPVEYCIPEINQIQVNHEKDIVFSQGLRSIVRQDPDVILVGEIRDFETAEIAVNASLTGHLLLTSLHANDSTTVITRLIEMGIEPFQLASTLSIVIAQRLVRKLCINCRYSKVLSRSEISGINSEAAKAFEEEVRVYESKGCPACNNKGFKGRIGIFEILTITPEIQDAIMSLKSAGDIWKIAAKQNTRSLFEDGVEKVKLGIISLSELVRVATPR
jgi:type IV pilus assembly protein PilB